MDIDAIIAEQDRKQDFIDALKAQPPKALEFPMRHDPDGKILISKDASKPGRWRVTRFARESGEWVPIGHADAKDYPAAVDYAADWSDLGYKTTKRFESYEPRGRRL